MIALSSINLLKIGEFCCRCEKGRDLIEKESFIYNENLLANDMIELESCGHIICLICSEIREEFSC
jgi:hypothetical protein